jgi:hypothetical protein
LASQRVTVVKVGGSAGDAVAWLLREWSSARQSASPSAWSSEQWPEPIRARADAFARTLREHALEPPVIYFAEWADLWSTGDLFARWLTPPDGPLPWVVHGDRVEVYGYGLPDGGRLARHLVGGGPQQFAETDWFMGQLWRAVGAWHRIVDRAALVVLRETVGAFVTDEEVQAACSQVLAWLGEGGAGSASQGIARAAQ